MPIVLRELKPEAAETCRLVLDASQIPHQLQVGQDGLVAIEVAPTDYARAHETLERYLEENPPGEPRHEPQAAYYQPDLTGIPVALGMLAFHVAVTLRLPFKPFAQAYGASAEAILQGELFRCVTALFIHASPAHVAGNMLGLALFGSGVCSLCGLEVGWLLIVLSGALGNLVNAAFFGREHLSVGASTAVFGAIGVLAALQFVAKVRQPGQRVKAWLPLAGGLALLGVLGSSPYTDLSAHLFGFALGVAFGVAQARLMRAPAPIGARVIAGTAAVLLSGGAWAWALWLR